MKNRIKKSLSLWFALVFLFSQPYLYAQNELSLPLNELKLTCAFGTRIHPITKKPDEHKGVDLQARNEPVYAILTGKVLSCGYQPILGNFIQIAHGSLVSIYGHLSIILVKKDEAIGSGAMIAVTGNTGRSTGEHLHFSLKANGIYIDPLKFFLAYFNSRSP